MTQIAEHVVSSYGLGRFVCPSCGGGSSREKSLLIGDYYGRLSAHCFRAGCGGWGYGLGSGHAGNAAPAASPSVLRPYTGDRVPLRIQNQEHLLELFGFVPKGTQTVGYTTERLDCPYVLPIVAPNGSERGVMEAVYGPHKRRRIWKAKDEPMISWTAEGDYYDGVYLVEDQISALKLYHFASIRACALLGTSLNAESVAEIQRNARHVTIALDADATANAFLLARRWGAAFKSCNVQILTKDFKDMSPTEIMGLMKDAGHIPTQCGGEFA